MPDALKQTPGMPKSLPLLIAVLAIYLTTPLWHESSFDNFLLGIFLILALGFGGSLVAGGVNWWRWFGIVAFVSFLPVLSRLSGFEVGVSEVLQRFFATSMGVLTLYVLHRFALFSRQEDLIDRILAAICAYLILGIVWSQMQEIVIYFDPQAMTDGGKPVVEGDPAILYHSLVTITTLGYGDVLPVNPYSRILSGLEAATGTIYLAVIIASLVAQAREPKDVSINLPGEED